MSSFAYVTWSSDANPHHPTCENGAHVFNAVDGTGSKFIAPTRCDCGETEWVFVKCEHCGQTHGEARRPRKKGEKK